MSAFDKIGLGDSGYEKFSMFGSSGGTAKYLVNDDGVRKYVGLFQSKEPLPDDNEWMLDVEEYLTVLEGEITIKFLDTDQVVVVGAGEIGYLPSGSRINLTLSKLPYAESFVMTAPTAA